MSVTGRSNRRSSQPLRLRLPPPRVLAAGLWRATRRALPALAASAAAAAVTGLVYLGHDFITTSPRFAITTIEFHGQERRTPEELRAQLPVVDGANLFTTHVGRLTEALAADPWLADVEIERRLPHTLVVTVRERVPAAMLELGGLYLADASGAPFKRARLAGPSPEGEGLPVITGIGRAELGADPAAAATVVREVLAVLAAWAGPAATPSARPRIGEVHVDSRHGIALHTVDDAVAIRLGPAAATGGEELARRLAQFDRTWAALAPAERARVRVLHLDHDTRPDHVTVALASIDS